MKGGGGKSRGGRVATPSLADFVNFDQGEARPGDAGWHKRGREAAESE